MPQHRPTRAELERHIRDLAYARDWEHHHARAAGLGRDGRVDGFPTDILFRDGRLLFVFTTGPRGDLTLREARWASLLAKVDTVDVSVVRCGDLSQIAATLKAGVGITLPGRRTARGVRRATR